MRIFKYKLFHQWAKHENLSDKALKSAIEEMEKGLFDANLGSGLYKKRVARKDQGKRSGYRTLIAFKQDDKTFFVYSFAKNERENISSKEKDIYKKLATYYLNLTETQLDQLIKNGELIEVIV